MILYARFAASEHLDLKIEVLQDHLLPGSVLALSALDSCIINACLEANQELCGQLGGVYRYILYILVDSWLRSGSCVDD